MGIPLDFESFLIGAIFGGTAVGSVIALIWLYRLAQKIREENAEFKRDFNRIKQNIEGKRRNPNYIEQPPPPPHG